jgi:hypothetical protein
MAEDPKKTLISVVSQAFSEKATDHEVVKIWSLTYSEIAAVYAISRQDLPVPASQLYVARPTEVPVEALIHKVVGMVQQSQNALLRAGSARRRCCPRPGADPGWPQDASLRRSRRKTKWKHSFNFPKPRLVIKTSFESSQKVIPRSNSLPGRDEQSCVTKVSTSKDDPPACSS